MLLCFRVFEISIVGVYRPPPYLGEELEKLFKTMLKASCLAVVKILAGSYLVAKGYETKLEVKDGGKCRQTLKPKRENLVVDIIVPMKCIGSSASEGSNS